MRPSWARVLGILILSAAALPSQAPGAGAASAGASQEPFQEIGSLSDFTGDSEAVAVNDAGHVAGTTQVGISSRHAFFWTPEDGMIDLGTLGGDESRAAAINGNDSVVGTARLEDGTERAFWTASGGIKDLGTLGGVASGATDINDAGQVVGWAQTDTGEIHAFLWTSADGMTDLGSLGGNSRAIAINGAGQVAGQYNDDGIPPSGFFWSAETGMTDLGPAFIFGLNDSGMVIGQAGGGGGGDDGDSIIGGVTTQGAEGLGFVWTAAGGRVDLPSGARPSAVNDAGKVAGTNFESTPGPTLFVWDSSTQTLTDLGSIGDGEMRAVGIDESDRIAGTLDSGPSIPNLNRAFFFTPADGFVDLGTLGGTFSTARASSRLAHVVGVSGLPTGEHAFLWTPDGGMVDLGALGRGNTRVNDLNDAGVVVGWSDAPGGGDDGDIVIGGATTQHAGGSRHAFRWTSSEGIQDLGTLGGSSSAAFSINESGLIAGSATDTSGQVRGALWTPDGAIHDLGFSGEARLINEAGLVVGLSFFDGAAHLVVWTPAGGAPILGHLGGGGMEVRDLNDAGQFVGDGTAGPAESRAFIGTVDGLAEIGTLGGAFSRARALNEAGTVVGDSSTSDGQTRAFAWTPGGGMEDLGPATEPFVNNPSSGGAAFVSPDDSGEPQAFLWDPDRGFFPLGNPGGGSFESLAVNSLGQVAATVVTSTGEFRSFFWPGPEAEDTTPPQILAASADPSAVWPPNHEMVDVRLTVEVVDDTDPSPTCRIVSVASSDPEEGPTFGPHAPDWLVTGDLTLLVRAERYRGDRTYTITIECADASGNVSTASLHVVVPHSRRR